MLEKQASLGGGDKTSFYFTGNIGLKDLFKTTEGIKV
jgi:hypothetical protein